MLINAFGVYITYSFIASLFCLHNRRQSAFILHHKLAKLRESTTPMRNRILLLFAHFRKRLSMLRFRRFKHRIPTKVRRSSGRNDVPRRPTDEHLRRRLRRRGKAEYALGVGRLILVSRQKFVQTVVTGLVEEPLDVHARKTPQGVVAQGGVLDDDRSVHFLGGQFAFFDGDLLRLALQFWQVDLFVDDTEGEAVAQNGNYLLEFFGIACYEC
mmetsp:Transcript_17574/g.37173  ORF Transcript_17574/g.37173 Transcript_17574/m.37173 type:complete len:213 (+) Transcript_17574:147-785(+)